MGPIQSGTRQATVDGLPRQVGEGFFDNLFDFKEPCPLARPPIQDIMKLPGKPCSAHEQRVPSKLPNCNVTRDRSASESKEEGGNCPEGANRE